jgi:hypothetical protein
MQVVSHHVARRRENELKAAGGPEEDAQGLVEFGCECADVDCERAVRVPLYVFRRIVGSGNQCVLRTGHHAFPAYRTIVSTGLMSIEEERV